LKAKGETRDKPVSKEEPKDILERVKNVLGKN